MPKQTAKDMKLLILLVTNDCNMFCSYCYAKGGEKKEYMSWETARKALDYALSKSKSFKIQFAGGEPLLAFGLIKQVVQYAKSHLRSVTLQMQTNGTLIDGSMAQELKRLDISLGVSLDGPIGINDQLRPLRGDTGSTPLVIRGLRSLAQEGIMVGLTTVLTRESAATLPELVDWAAYAGNVYGISLDLVRPLGRGLEPEVLLPEPCFLEGQVNAALYRADELVRLGGPRIRFREVERLRYQMEKEVTREDYCYATTGQSMAVMPDGAIYPCASLMLLPEFHLGNINDPAFAVTRTTGEKAWFGRKVDSMAKCKNCPDKHFCGGGCLARAYAYTGRVDVPYEGDCQLKKTFLKWVRGSHARPTSDKSDSNYARRSRERKLC